MENGKWKMENEFSIIHFVHQHVSTLNSQLFQFTDSTLYIQQRLHKLLFIKQLQIIDAFSKPDVLDGDLELV